MNENRKVITDSAAADFLTNPETRNLLAPFMARETPMAEAAKALGLGLNTLHRRVGQMLALGLLELTREEVRDRHRVKLYRATHGEFIVPLEATTQVDLKTLTETGFRRSVSVLSEGVAKAMERACPRWGFKIYLEEDYGLLQKAIPLCPDEEDSEEKAFWYGDSWLQLSESDAKAFRRELQALYDKYRHTENPDGSCHFFFAGLSPV